VILIIYITQWILIHMTTLHEYDYWSEYMNNTKDQPLCSNCPICGVGPSAGQSSPWNSHMCHTQISLYVFSEVSPAPLSNLLYVPHHLQHMPTKNTVCTVMLAGLLTNMSNILEGWFSPGSHSCIRAFTIIANKHVLHFVEYSSKVFLCQLPISSNEVFKVILSS
jgi:hypothetical protein